MNFTGNTGDRKSGPTSPTCNAAKSTAPTSGGGKAARLRSFEPSTRKRIRYLSSKLGELATAILPGVIPDGSTGVCL